MLHTRTVINRLIYSDAPAYTFIVHAFGHDLTANLYHVIFNPIAIEQTGNQITGIAFGYGGSV